MQQATQGQANAKNRAGPLARVTEVEGRLVGGPRPFPHTPSRQPEYVCPATLGRSLPAAFVLLEARGSLKSSLAIYGALLHEEKVRWASFGAREPLYACGVSGRGSFLASHAFDPLHPSSSRCERMASVVKHNGQARPATLHALRRVGIALRERYKPQQEIPHGLLVLLMQLDCDKTLAGQGQGNSVAPKSERRYAVSPR